MKNWRTRITGCSTVNLAIESGLPRHNRDLGIGLTVESNSIDAIFHCLTNLLQRYAVSSNFVGPSMDDLPRCGRWQHGGNTRVLEL